MLYDPIIRDFFVYFEIKWKDILVSLCATYVVLGDSKKMAPMPCLICLVYYVGPLRTDVIFSHKHRHIFCFIRTCYLL